MAGSRSYIDGAKVEVVEELFSGSEVGRAFLDGLMQTRRDEDLERIFEALGRLEAHTGAVRDEARIETLREELKSMSDAIAQTRDEIAAIKPDQDSSSRIMAATEELDAIITATERATSDILGAAERIQVTTQGMREGGIDERICNMIDEQATNIFMACSFQDITGQRVQKVVNLLRYLEQRINTMVGLWQTEKGEGQEEEQPAKEMQFNPMDQRPDAHLLNGPSREGDGVSQDDVDRMLGMDDVEAAVAEAAPETIEEEAVEPVAEAHEPTPEMEAPVAAEPAVEAVAEEEIELPAGETVDQDDIDALFG